MTIPTVYHCSLHRLVWLAVLLSFCTSSSSSRILQHAAFSHSANSTLGSSKLVTSISSFHVGTVTADPPESPADEAVRLLPRQQRTLLQRALSQAGPADTGAAIRTAGGCTCRRDFQFKQWVCNYTTLEGEANQTWCYVEGSGCGNKSSNSNQYWAYLPQDSPLQGKSSCVAALSVKSTSPVLPRSMEPPPPAPSSASSNNSPQLTASPQQPNPPRAAPSNASSNNSPQLTASTQQPNPPRAAPSSASSNSSSQLTASTQQPNSPQAAKKSSGPPLGLIAGVAVAVAVLLALAACGYVHWKYGCATLRAGWWVSKPTPKGHGPLNGLQSAGAATEQGRKPPPQSAGCGDHTRDDGPRHDANRGLHGVVTTPPCAPIIPVPVGAAAPMGLGAVATFAMLQPCLTLASSIVTSADRVVINNHRCSSLLKRVGVIGHCLNSLQAERVSRDMTQGARQGVDAALSNVKDVLTEVNLYVESWCSDTVGSTILSVVRNMMVSTWFESRFLELQLKLNGATQDLMLARNVEDHAPRQLDQAKLAEQAHADTSKDLESLVQQLVTMDQQGKDRWSALSNEDKEKLQEIFDNHGMDLSAAIKKARMDKLDEKVGQLIIHRSDLKLQRELGSGGFGNVYAGLWGVGETPVAVKQLQVTALTEVTKADIKKEAYIHLQAHNHPNVCKLYGVVLEDARNCLLVMELCAGDLVQVLSDDTKVLSWGKKLAMALDVANGLAHLHSKFIVHGDVKPSNFLVREDGTVVVSDFGLSNVVALTISRTTRTVQHLGGSSSSSSAGISLWYTAPELLEDVGAPKTMQADMYALGMVLLEIAVRRIPFQTGQVDVAVVNYVISGKRPTIPSDVPEGLAVLIRSCWGAVPSNRPSAADAVRTLRALLASVRK